MTMTPSRIYQNTTVNLPVEFKDQNGNLDDPDTLVFTFVSPQNVTTTLTYGVDAALSKESIGKYNVDFDVGEFAGRWHWRWHATSDSIKIGKEGSFVVQTSPFYEQSGTYANRRY